MKVLNWIFELFNTNKTHVVQRSLTGESLVKINESMYGVGVSSTNSGIMRANIMFNCTQIHDYNSLMRVVKNEYDKYLTKEDKNKILELLTRSNPITYSWVTERNSKGNLVFKRVFWLGDQTKELYKYLEKL